MSKLAAIEHIEREWAKCSRCPLAKTRAHVVQWRGSVDAKLFVVGEAPGADEDAAGRPFVGQAGRKLDGLFRECGLDPLEDVFIANMVGCRPPGNRVPEPTEIKACSPRLESLLALVEPKAVLLLGGTASRLAGIRKISAWRGEPVELDVGTPSGGVASYPAMPTFHPSYLLRSGGSDKVKRAMLSDIAQARMMAYGK